MPSSIIAGFITKKEACRIYNRSHRQLTRDVGTAMVSKDERVLGNLLLRTEDGEARAGIEVTTQLISTLRTEGLNPLWYVRATWMERSFGKRSDPNRASKEETNVDPIEGKAKKTPSEKPPTLWGFCESESKNWNAIRANCAKNSRSRTVK